MRHRNSIPRGKPKVKIDIISPGTRRAGREQLAHYRRASNPDTTSPIIAFDYRQTHLERIALSAVRRFAWLPMDVRDEAISAAATFLLEQSERPDEVEIHRVVYKELSTMANREMEEAGLVRDREHGGYKPRDRYLAYWWQPPAQSFDERIVERIAVDQVMALITPGQRRALEALAECGDYHDAAAQLGIGYTTLIQHLVSARRTIKVAWFAPETPRPLGKGSYDRRRLRPELQTCVNGHLWEGNEGFRKVGGKDSASFTFLRRGRYCRECNRITQKAAYQRRKQLDNPKRGRQSASP